MLKKNRQKIAALAFVFMTFMSSTVFAKTSLTPNETTSIPKTEKKAKMHGRCLKKEAFDKLLKDIGLTKEDLDKGRESNKTFFDLAKEKGYTEKQVKEMLIKNKTEAINKAVQEGKLTKEEADKMTEKVKERTLKWDGSLKRPERKNKDKTE